MASDEVLAVHVLRWSITYAICPLLSVWLCFRPSVTTGAPNPTRLVIPTKFALKQRTLRHSKATRCIGLCKKAECALSISKWKDKSYPTTHKRLHKLFSWLIDHHYRYSRCSWHDFAKVKDVSCCLGIAYAQQDHGLLPLLSIASSYTSQLWSSVVHFATCKVVY